MQSRFNFEQQRENEEESKKWEKEIRQDNANNKETEEWESEKLNDEDHEENEG